VPNPDAKLRFGMYVNTRIGGRAAPSLTVPRAAVQMIGPDSVVFVPAGTDGAAFRARRVRLGPADGDRLAVLDGLSAGDRVVSKGSFVVRAEAERLGVGPVSMSDQAGRVAARPSQDVSVTITPKGFEPDSLALRAGIPARVTFTRTTDETCAKEIVFPDYGIRRALPLNTPVVVEFVPAAKNAGFQCGMGMLAGKLVVR